MVLKLISIPTRGNKNNWLIYVLFNNIFYNSGGKAEYEVRSAYIKAKNAEI